MAVDDGSVHHELVKVKFVEFKEDKKTLAPELAETSSQLIMRVGNVAVLYRAKLAATLHCAASRVRILPELLARAHLLQRINYQLVLRVISECLGQILVRFLCS